MRACVRAWMYHVSCGFDRRGLRDIYERDGRGCHGNDDGDGRYCHGNSGNNRRRGRDYDDERDFTAVLEEITVMV